MKKHGSMRQISVESWHALAQDGCDIPITICLNGESMRPLIRKNLDPVTIIPMKRQIRKGDIVLFADERGRYVVHRVWKKQGNTVQTLGDHCLWPDAPMEEPMVWGLAVRVQRGAWKIPLNHPMARILGRIWMALRPVRFHRYKRKNRGKPSGIQ